MIKLIIMAQLIQPYFNPEFGGILYLRGEKIIDSTYKASDLHFEFVMKGPVDPYFLFYGVFPISAEGIELEEAYITTLTLPFKINLGKFKSKFTRLNPQHIHSWDFPELPHIYEFLPLSQNEEHEHGTEGINDIGVGISYILPMNIFLEPGIEILKGEESNFDYFLFYSHLSYDLPFFITLWLSPSLCLKRDTLKWSGVELVIKRIKPGEERTKGLLFTGGYYQGKDKNHRGGYFDFVYKFTYGWRLGLRVDLIKEEKPEYTFMIDYSPTEFSRFRLSYKFREKKIFFEANFSIGPHGAHPF